MITHKRLLEVILYDPETGRFVWRRTLSSKGVSGRVAGSKRSDGYISIRIDQRRYYAHRLAWFYQFGVWPSELLDHVNHDPSDNRIANLREASHAENVYNGCGPKPGQSGFRGVVWHSRDRVWQARIRRDGHRVSLGTYRTASDAANAYDIEARRLHGRFAVLNFPTGDDQ